MNVSKLFLFGALILVLLSAACAAEEGETPAPIGTTLPDATEFVNTPTGGVDTIGTADLGTATTAETATGGLETATGAATDALSTATAGTPVTGGTQTTGTQTTGGTPGIPVTGVDIVLVECQFCIDTMAHALLVLPDTATFQIVSPAPSTTTSTDPTQPTCSTVEVNNGKQVVLCSGPEMTPLTVNICTNGTTCTDFPVDLLACPLTQSSTAVPNATQGTGSGGVTVSTATPSLLATPSATVTP